MGSLKNELDNGLLYTGLGIDDSDMDDALIMSIMQASNGFLTIAIISLACLCTWIFMWWLLHARRN